MKLKCQNALMSLLGKASAVALENMASEVPSFTLSFFPLLFWRWFRQRQARSQILPDLLLNNILICLNAIAIWDRTVSLCYSYKSPLSHNTTGSSHRNFLTNFRRMIAILDCVRDICKGARLCAPTDRLFYPIENRYEAVESCFLSPLSPLSPSQF
jgi:hypothetical protein